MGEANWWRMPENGSSGAPKNPQNSNLIQLRLSASHSLIWMNSRDDKGSIDVLVASGESLLVMIWVSLCLLAMVVCVCAVCVKS
jgi:hypothetical protein